MTLSFLLYLVLSGFAVLLCLWAAASAAVRVDEHDTVHRGWTFLAGTLLPPVTAVAAFAGTFDWPYLAAAGAVLPILVIAGTWSNVMTLKDQGGMLKLLHLPVFAFNASLAGIYGVRALQDLCGIDMGDWGTTITGGDSLLQVWIGQQSADTNPIWLHLPFLMPLWLRYQWPHRLALGVSSILAAALLALLVMSMPFAYIKAQSYRAAPPVDELGELPLTLRVGVKVPWSERVLEERQLLGWRADLLGLAIDHIAVDVGPEILTDDLLFQQVQREVGFARQRGLHIVVVTTPAAAFQAIPARDVHELTSGMRRTQRLVAEKLQPDLLVLFSGPFGRLAGLSAKIGTLEQWREIIEQAAADVRHASKKVRLAVAVESQAPHAYELFRWLKSEQAPVDVAGISLYPGQRTMDEMHGVLATLERWCRRTPGEHPVRIVETGACPYSCGGELGQWHFLRMMLATAVRTAPQEGICIDGLVDGLSANGLVSRSEHQRLAYWQLDRMLRHRAPATPR